ncbi:MAG TPA: homoserine O-acetyltransferase [Acidimicrobiales bacterium]|nr:homoserine O-acetyltransferase [Acidimicrobiales bacterium]
MTEAPYPGVWRPGDEPGRRHLAVLSGPGDAGFALEAGGRLEDITVAYETWGTLNDARDNAVLVLHALTGDSHVVGPLAPGHPSKGWWDGLIGTGAPVDTDRFFVVCPNVLGGCQGTTGPGSLHADGRPYGSRFPVITIRDQVAVEVALADQLGIGLWAGVVGGSMGGMRVLEWCVGFPARVAGAVVLSVGAAASADQIALCSLQVRAIRSDPAFHGGDYYETPLRPVDGLSVARGIGHYSYRTGAEFEERFGREAQGQEEPLKSGRYAIESYLQYHGEKLAKRFDPNSYIALSEAMNHHDVGRGRGGIAEALGGVRADVTVAGITTDRLYPLALQEEIADCLPGRPTVSVVESFSGHDGFLLEIEQVGRIVRQALSPAH